MNPNELIEVIENYLNKTYLSDESAETSIVKVNDNQKSKYKNPNLQSLTLFTKGGHILHVVISQII